MTAVTMTPSRRSVRPEAGGRVVVGIDDSPAGLAALRCAIGFARAQGARLIAVRAWALGLPRHGGLRRRGSRTPVVITFRGTAPGHAARNLAERAFRAVDGGVPDDIDVTIETPEGNPALVLTQIASGSDDVLVVGTRPGPSLRRAMHGSVSAYCAAHARCPVTVVRPRRRSANESVASESVASESVASRRRREGHVPAFGGCGHRSPDRRSGGDRAVDPQHPAVAVPGRRR